MWGGMRDRSGERQTMELVRHMQVQQRECHKSLSHLPFRGHHGTVAVALETAAKLCIATSFARRDETAQVRMLAHRSRLSA